jgi:hypothetical protein
MGVGIKNADAVSSHTMKVVLFPVSVVLAGLSLCAQTAQVTVRRPAARPVQTLQLEDDGANRDQALAVANSTLLRGGKPWWGLTGEFPFGRISEKAWELELVRLKGAGVDVLLVDLAWSLHEPREGSFDWSGQKALGAFLGQCNEQGLSVVLCLGPGNPLAGARNSLPAWLEAKGVKLRGDDPRYLKEVGDWYAEVARQTKGRLRKDGGAVLGVQLEADFSGPAQTLLQLKTLAREAGLAVPLYLYSARASLTTPVPAGELYRLPEAGGAGLWKAAGMPGDGRLSLVSTGFRAPLGKLELGYRRLGLFLSEFGAPLASMEGYESEEGGLGGGATEWQLRQGPSTGFLLLSNRGSAPQSYQLGLTLPDFEEPQLRPLAPARVPPGARTVWPLNLPLNAKVTLAHASAMPLCILEDETQRVLLLGAMPGVPAEIAISADVGVRVSSPRLGEPEIRNGSYVFSEVQPGHEPVIDVRAPGQLNLRIVLLSDEDALRLAKIHWLGQSRVVIWGGLVLQDGERMDLYDETGRAAVGKLLVYPAPADLNVGGRKLEGRKDGLFTAYEMGKR